MANPKKGLQSYTVDTDRYSDRRIRMLRRQFSCAGVAVYDYILCEVYRTNGCFLEWDESTALDVADYFGIKTSVVTEVVKYCGHVGLFDRELLSCGAVTSSSIQRRYVELCGRSRRKAAQIPERYRLIPAEGAAEADAAGLEEEVRMMRADTAWLERLAGLHRTDTAGIGRRLDEFRAQCESDGRTGHGSVREAKSHFNNWIRKVDEKERSKKDEADGHGGRDRRSPSLLRADEEETYTGTF